VYTNGSLRTDHRLQIDTRCKQPSVTRVKLCTADTCSCVRQGYECAREVYAAEEEVYAVQFGNTCPHCGCNGLCQNQSLQLLRESRVRLEEYGPNRSLTLVTCQAVQPSTALIEWRGVVRVDKCQSMTGVTCPALSSQHVYHCHSDALVIDSTIFGNEARFIHRTRDADSVNCALVEKFIGEELHVTVVSTCHIEVDTPLALSETQFEANKFQQSQDRALVSMAEFTEDLQSLLLDLEKFRVSEPKIAEEDEIIFDEVSPVTQSVKQDVAPVSASLPNRAPESVARVTDPELELTLAYLARDPFARLVELESQVVTGDTMTGVTDMLAANVDHVPLNTDAHLLTELAAWRLTRALHLVARSHVFLPYLEEYHELVRQFNLMPIFGARTSLGIIALLKNHVTTMFRFNGGTCQASFVNAEQLIENLEQDLRCPYCHAGHLQPLCDTCQRLRTNPDELHFDRYAPMKQAIFANLRAKSGDEWLQEFIVKEIPQKQPFPVSLEALELCHMSHIDNLSRALVALTNLRVLRVDGARMHWTAALTALPLLELRLKQVKNLNADDLQLIGGMVALRCLDLTHSALHVTHAFSELRRLSALQQLTLDDTTVSDAGLWPLLLTLPLMELNVRHCTALHLTALALLYHVTSLRALGLAQCHVNAPLIGLMLTHLTQLTALDVSHVNLKVTPHLLNALVCTATQLQHVDLRGCVISTEHRNVLKKIAKVHTQLLEL
jgi:hypothetical protein